MSLKELLLAVRDESLGKDRLEKLHSEMTHLHSDMQVELADIEKEEALFFLERTNPQTSDVSIKRLWRAGGRGQREIELNRYIKTVAKELNSLKSRLFSIY
jgi:hypothetical protein